jgi:hypothetical protein
MTLINASSFISQKQSLHATLTGRAMLFKSGKCAISRLFPVNIEAVSGPLGFNAKPQRVKPQPNTFFEHEETEATE